MSRYHNFLFLLAGISLLAACTTSKEDMSEKAIDQRDLNESVAPGDDFYEYANGGWLKTAKIPDDKSAYSSFNIVQERNEEKLKDILFRAMEHRCDTTNENWRKIGDFFASGMDSTAIEEAGLSPIQADLDMIDMIESTKDFSRELARLRPIGGSSPIYITTEQDSKNATEVILSIYQSGLGMPDRDLYFDEGERPEMLRKEYQKMLVETFKILGYTPEAADSITKKIFELETKLAKVAYTRLQYRDPELIYNKVSTVDLKKIAPNIDWEIYFQNLGLDLPKSLLLDNPKFLAEVNKLLKEQPMSLWKAYLKVHYTLSNASCLHQALGDVYFNFYGRAVAGQKAQRTRWKRVMGQCENAMGEAIGALFVEENFPPAAKERMLHLVDNLINTYRKRINQLTWMSKETKERAQEKLNSFTVKIGYPDKWRDYSDLSVSRDDYAMNVRNGRIFAFNYRMRKLGKPIDRTEWLMYPQTVNAYYNPTMNDIVFPAGILQPPFFNMDADDAVNYGGIGVVIAHEITHGFDDQGRKYDKDGNLNEWWTKEDAERFTEYTKLLVDQFNDFEAIDGEHVNGQLTLGENLADYGGLTISMQAFKELLAEQEKEGNPAKEIDGFTPLQRFFLAYAKVWRARIRDEALKHQLKVDVHSPARFRVNGGVYNIDEFYQAFEVQPSSPYYRAPDQRPSIW